MDTEAAPHDPSARKGTFSGARLVVRRLNSPLYVLASSLFILRLGTAMTAVGLPLLVIHRYGLTFQAGVTLALEFLPSVLLGPVVGDIIDRTEARTMAMLGPLVCAASIALLPFTADLWQVQTLALLAGIGYAVGVPARLALRSRVVDPESRARGNGILLAAQRLPLLLGPAVAGALIPVGYTALFLTDSVSALIAVVVLFRVPRGEARAGHNSPTTRAGASDPILRQLAAAFRRLIKESVPQIVRAIASDRALSALAATALSYMFAFGMTRLFLATYAVTRFPEHTGMFGLLTAAMGAGAVTGSLIAARFSRWPQGAVYVTVSIIEGACWLSIPMSHSAPLSIAAIAIAGVCESIGTVIFYAEAQARLPTELEGRFFAILIGLTDLFTVLGTLAAGVVVTHDVSRASWIIAAVMAVPVLALCPIFLRPRYWTRPSTPPRPTSAPDGE